jgi:hypothetical protein
LLGAQRCCRNSGFLLSKVDECRQCSSESSHHGSLAVSSHPMVDKIRLRGEVQYSLVSVIEFVVSNRWDSCNRTTKTLPHVLDTV